MNRFYTSVRSIHPEIRQIIYTFNSALEPETAKGLSNRKPTSDQTNQVKWKEKLRAFGRIHVLLGAVTCKQKPQTEQTTSTPSLRKTPDQE
jgi:hypothetical protein